jgi:hypothetical protein
MASSSTRRNERPAFAGHDHGQSVLGDVLALASTIIESGKHAGAQKIFAVAGSSRGFGKDVDELPHLHAYAEAVADGLEDLADYIDRSEVREIFDDIGTLARRQPVLSVAFTLAAGIAVTQVVRNWRTPERAVRRRTRSMKRPRRKTNGRGKR